MREEPFDSSKIEINDLLSRVETASETVKYL